MLSNGINLWAVLVSAIASMVIGSIWYGPLFGKMYMSLMGMDQWSPEKKTAMKNKMMWSYLGQFVASVLMFFVLDGLFVWSAPMQTVYFGMWLAFFMWLGFMLPLIFGNILWGGKAKMFWLQAGNTLITILVAGAIIGAMH
jgi:hypothetical protein